MRFGLVEMRPGVLAVTDEDDGGVAIPLFTLNSSQLGRTGIDPEKVLETIMVGLALLAETEEIASEAEERHSAQRIQDI